MCGCSHLHAFFDLSHTNHHAFVKSRQALESDIFWLVFPGVYRGESFMRLTEVSVTPLFYPERSYIPGGPWLGPTCVTSSDVLIGLPTQTLAPSLFLLCMTTQKLILILYPPSPLFGLPNINFSHNAWIYFTLSVDPDFSLLVQTVHFSPF